MPTNAHAAVITQVNLPVSFLVGEWSVFSDFSYIEHSSGRREELEWMAIEVLRFLASRQGQLVSVDELMEGVWTGKIVTEGTVRRIISLLRKAFGDDAKAPAYIQSIPKRGYVLIAAVSMLTVSAPPATHPVSSGKNIDPALRPATSFSPAQNHSPLQQPPRRFSGRKLLIGSGLLAGLLAAVLLLWWPQPTLQFEPVLVLKGPDRDPFLDSQGQALVFSHKNQQNDNWHLYRQDLKNQHTQQLTYGELNEFMPQIAPNRDKLAYLQIEQQSIRIMLADLRQDGLLGQSKVLFESKFGISDLLWNGSGSGLYLSTADQSGVFSVWFLPLDTLEAKRITLPPESTIGDLHLALSADDQHLALIRVNGKASVLSNSTSTLQMYKLDGMVPVLTKQLPGRAQSVGFADNKLVYLIDNTIYQLDPAQQQSSKVLLAHQHPISQMTLSDQQLLLSYGDLYNAEIREVPNPFEEPTTTAAGMVISSQTSDYFAEYGSNDGKVYFLSTRSGSRQVWMWEPKKGYRQLSKFKESFQLSMVSAAHQQDLLAGISDQKAFIIDTVAGDTRYLTTEKGVLVQVFWHNNDSGLYYVLQTATEKSLWLYDLASGQSKLIRRQVESAQSFMDQLLVWTGQEFQWLDQTGQPVQRAAIQLQPLDVNSHWQIVGQYLYQTVANGAAYQLYRTDLLSGQTLISEKYALGPYRSHFSVAPDQQRILMTYFTEPETDIYRLSSKALWH